MPTSMILRFRDFGPLGSTIQRHKEIIESQPADGAWWAWWAKPDERIPRELFARFREVIQEHGHLDVYLADSGQYLLYRARLVEIRESATESPIASPEPNRTPEYYRATPYKAWFRLTKIAQIAPEEVERELRKWSYDEVVGFTADPHSSVYQDKQIFSIQEILHRRHRTIYFVQPYTSAHSTHLVETVPGVQPKNFMADPIVSKSSYLLHLSDLHFGPEHDFALAEGEPGKRTLARLIIDDLLGTLNLGPPAGVVITGDLTWQAETLEFCQTRSFLERLKSELRLESYHFLIVPGNHDIRWSPNPADKRQKVSRPPDEAKSNFREFYIGFFGIPPMESFSQGRRFLLGNFVTTDVLGVSSTELEQKHFGGYGYVTAEQLRHAMAEMNWKSDALRTTYRFLALHHHVVPVVPEEEIKTFDKNFSLTLDAGHVLYECLAAGVDVIVHGHQHQPFCAAFSRSIRRGQAFKPERTVVVSAAGSAGVKRQHIPAAQNTYTIYEIAPETVRIRVRKVGDARVGFEDAEEWSSLLRRNSAGGMMLTSFA